MTGLPAGCKLELEFTAGNWTDVSADVDGEVAIPIHFGRTSEYSSPSAGTMQVQLVNDVNCSTGQGSYTPGRQVLYDGVTAAPYWPNVVPRIGIRFSYTISAVTYYRFTGFVKAIQPLMIGNGMVPRVLLVCTDILDQLSRITLQNTMLTQEMATDLPVYFWPMTDPVGSTDAAEFHGYTPLGSAGYPSGFGPAFGQAGPGLDGTTGLAIAASEYLAATVTRNWLLAVTGAVWVMLTAYPTISAGIAAFGAHQLSVDSAGNLTETYVSVSAVLALNTWYYIAVTVDASGNEVVYVNGVSVGTGTGKPSFASFLYVGDVLGAFGTAVVMNLGYTAIYQSALTAGRIQAHYAAGLGYVGDTTGARIARILGWAGLTSAQWNLDTGKAIVGFYQQITVGSGQPGKTILQYGQDMTVTEGGGSVFYATPDGKVRFADRSFRKPGAPGLTVDAGADLDGTQFLPSLDDLTLVNQIIANRVSGQTTESTQTYANATSVALDGLSSTQVSTYATTDLDALNLAQSMVADQSLPAFRLPKVTVDLISATSAGLYAAAAGLQIGSRMRVTSLDAAAAPSTQLDLIVEGWTETVSTDLYSIAFDTSAADTPARGVWGSSRWRPDTGSMTVHTGGITSSATTLVVDTAAGHSPFTTVSGSYPLVISVGAEDISLNSAPSGGTSPQTFTGITRGVAGGGPACAHTAGSVVDLSPAATWTLG